MEEVMKKKHIESPVEVRSIYEDLGYKNHEEMETKANLVMKIANVIKRKKLTQTQCAVMLSISQPKVSELLNGRFRGYSVERLMHFLNALGQDVEIVVKERLQTRSARVSVHHFSRTQARKVVPV
jgi:predicted XRE-type DNA-binding protein